MDPSATPTQEVSPSTTIVVTTTVPPLESSTTGTPVALPPVGEAYLAAIESACDDMCPDTGAWISVSPNHRDSDEALAAIAQAYPDARIVDPDVADGYPWTGEVLNIARVDDRSDPATITLEIAFDADRRNPLPCADVFPAVSDGGSRVPADPAELSIEHPVAEMYQGNGCT